MVVADADRPVVLRVGRHELRLPAGQSHHVLTPGGGGTTQVRLAAASAALPATGALRDPPDSLRPRRHTGAGPGQMSSAPEGGAVPRLRVMCAIGVCAAVLPVAAGAGSAASSICGPGKTALGGTLLGDPDRRALNATVNVELTDAATSRAYDVYTDGRIDTVGHPAGTRYSYVDHANPEVGPRNGWTRRERLDRTWGRPRGEGVLCFTTNPRIALAYIEIYPRRAVDSDGDGRTDRYVTDRSKYGAAAHYRQPVRAGADNTGIVLRLPQNIPSKVGYLHGYITYRGRAVPVAAPGCGTGGRPACNGITHVRAFPNETRGTNCGIEGFSASADGLDPTTRGGAATYYRINALAGGRCGSASQSYNPRVTCVSFCGRNAAGGLTRTVGPRTMPAVRSGAGTQADFSFG